MGSPLARLVVCVAVLECATAIAAQTHEIGSPPIRAFSPEVYDGDNQVWSAAVSASGTRWFTQTGSTLVGFDGSRWLHLPTDSEWRSLASDATGRVYCGGAGNVGYIDDTTEQPQVVSLVAHLPAEQRAFHDCITIRDTPAGVLFVCPDRILRWNGTHLSTSRPPRSERCPLRRAVWSDGRLLLWQDDVGLVAWSPQDDRYTELATTDEHRGLTVRALEARTDGTPLAFARDGTVLESRPDGTHAATRLADSIAGLRIQTAATLATGQILLGTLDHGLVMLDPELEILAIYGTEDGLPSDTVFAVRPASRHEVWVCTDAGIGLIDFDSPHRRLGAGHGIDDGPLCMLETEEDLWVGTPYGLLRAEREPRMRRLRFVADPRIDSCWDLLAFEDAILVAGEKVTELRGTASQEIADLDTYTMLLLDDPTRLVIGATSGIWVAPREGDRWGAPTQVPGIGWPVNSLAEARDGSLWAVTRNADVLRFRVGATTDAWTLAGRWKHGSVEPFLLRSGDDPLVLVRDFHPHVLEPERVDEAAWPFRELHPMLRGDVFDVAPRRSGGLWLDIDGELHVTPRLDDVPRRVIGSGSVPDGAWFFHRPGRSDDVVWLTRDDGLIRVDTTLADVHEPAVRATLRAFDAEGSRITAPLSSPGAVTIEATVNAFDAIGPTWYRWRASPLRDAWSSWSTSPTWEIEHLPAGTTTIAVQTQTPLTGRMAPVELVVTAHRRWFVRLPMVLLYAAVLIGGTVTVLRFRQRRLRTRTLELERRVVVRTAELATERERAQRRADWLRGTLERSPIPLVDIDASRLRRMLLTDGSGQARSRLHELSADPSRAADLLDALQIRGVSHAALELFHAADLATLQSGIGRILSGTAFDAFRDLVQDWLDDRTSGNGTVCVHDLRGEERWIWFGFTIPPEHEDWSQILVAMRDETAQRQAELRARTAERLESVGLLASGVAHDFNNLMAAIRGNLAGLDDGDSPTDAPNREACMAAIDHAVRDASELCESLLAYAGRGRITPEPIDLAGMLREQLSVLRVRTPTSVQLRLDVDDALPPAHADTTQIRQVIRNTLTNAIEAIGEGPGTVAIRALERTWTASPRTADGRELPPGRYIEVGIADDGAGISPADMERIFEPFYSTKRPGRGLGLSAVLGILRAHGGAAAIDSTPGVGTRFSLWLPVAEQDSRNSEPPPSDQGSLRTKRILVVDDDPAVLIATTRLLRGLEAEIETAASGIECLERLSNVGAPPIDCIVLDWWMPEPSREELVTRIRAIADVAILVTSGHAHPDSGFGDVDGFLAKPFTRRSITAAMLAACERHRRVSHSADRQD